MTKSKVVHLCLAPRERRIARMRAGQLELTLTAYVAGLIRQDAEVSGIDQIVASDGPTPNRTKEVGRG